MTQSGQSADSQAAAAQLQAGEARLRAIRDLAGRGGIEDKALRALGRAFAQAGEVTRAEASALFALEAADAETCSAWRPFFVEAVTSHIVWEARPTGIVNEAQGEWLLGEADKAATLGALAVLVNVLAEAHRVPLWFLAAVRARAMRGWSGTHLAIAAAEAETQALGEALAA